MKKLLMLGGAYSQIPAIKCAKDMGYYVITCDYLPDNPGHKYSDEYVNISTIDKKAVLEYALKSNIDGISAFASDPAAETAAYVSEVMNLPGANVESTKIMAEKDIFRKFQKDNGFRYPNFCCILEYDDIESIRWDYAFPCMVKPVDSSGSKGVKKANNEIEMKQAVKEAFAFSRNKRVIIEEFIDSPYNQIHGEGFIKDGKLKFVHLGEQHFYHEVPIGTGCPSFVDGQLIKRAEEEVARIIGKIGFEVGAVNIELRIGADGEITVIEIGPRSGGNYMPLLIEYSSGFDEVKACILAAMGKSDDIDFLKTKNEYIFQYIIGSPNAGIFKELKINDTIRNKIIKLYMHKCKGDIIDDYRNSSGVVGVMLIRCDSADDMKDVISNIYQYVEVVLEEKL